MELSLGLALLAGFLSFVSPCVLPLVPAYIGYMGGRVTNTVAAQVNSDGTVSAASPTLTMRFNTFLHGLAFVFGFAFVFVSIGILTTAFLQQVGGQNVFAVIEIIGRLGGVMIIFFGLHFMGVLPPVFERMRAAKPARTDYLIVAGLTLFGVIILLWGFAGNVFVWESIYWNTRAAWAILLGVISVLLFLMLMFLGEAFTKPGLFLTRLANTLDNMFYADTRREMVATGNDGFSGSALMGVIFAAGWTPCIGPVYGAILTMSASTADVGQAASLLSAYALGLGIPFLLSALMLDSAQGGIRRLQRHMPTIKLVSGALLLIIGVLVASGELQSLSQSLGNQFIDVSIRVETCVLGWVEGEVYFEQLGGCLNGTYDAETLIEMNTTGQTTIPASVESGS